MNIEGLKVESDVILPLQMPRVSKTEERRIQEETTKQVAAIVEYHKKNPNTYICRRTDVFFEVQGLSCPLCGECVNNNYHWDMTDRVTHARNSAEGRIKYG